jgi:SHS2 domain-containing protein
MINDITRADIAFRAYGSDLGELFKSAADALLAIMVENPEEIGGDTQKNIKLDNGNIEMLLYNFLQEFLFFKDSESLLLKAGQISQISIEEKNGSYRLECITEGEKIDRKKHRFNVDIKAVTLHKFSVTRDDSGWSAIVVLDV